MPVWNLSNAKHLLSRALFGYSRKDLEVALSYKTVEEFVAKQLLADKPLPAPPDVWINEVPIANNNTVDGDRYRAFTYWWYQNMLTEGTNMREKMVLFWHNHFVSGRDKVNYPQHMYKQQDLFRKAAWGNLQQLTKDISIDPAMLIYLDGRVSSGNGTNVPNENYARELMELFTIGIGNYTEADIRQAALALSGWRVNGLNSTFNQGAWLNANKIFMGKTGNFRYNDIVDIIFARTETPEFICRKLYKEFVYYKSNEAFVKEMAKVLVANKFEIKPVLQFMLTSDEFFNPQYQGSKIKNPTEMSIGILKSLDIKTVGATDLSYIYDQTRNMQQQLLQPPNVRGWVGQRDWISSTTYVLRGGFASSILDPTGRGINGQRFALRVMPVDYARTFKSPEAATKLVADVIDLFLQVPITSKKEKFLLDTMLDGTITTNWSTSTPGADKRIRNLLTAIMRLPEFQMC
jgi:uncharacterized protein (DUF1800 family)